MNRAIEWFASNRVAANLLMIVILAAGTITLAVGLRKEVFPEISLDLITVSVEYLGATPEEVEEAVNVRIEEEIQGLDGVKRITSQASEGIGVVSVELELGADTREILDDIKSRVDAIDTFPEETEKPVIREIKARRQVLFLAIAGETDERSLRHVAERVRDDLSALPEISIVELANARPYEIAVEVSEQSLRRHGLTFDDVAQAVRQSSLDLPAGSVKTEGGEILLRTKGQAYVRDEFESLVVLTNPDGSRLLLRDIANIVDGFADTDQFSRFDGKPAIIVQLFRTGDQSALEIADAVKSYVRQSADWLPEGISITTWQDNSRILRDRLELLTRNGLYGFLLVVLILALFLRFRLALWVSLGIPVSFLGAIWLMPKLDVSVNMISLFAFIVVLGIVVDDAIIIGENIYTHQTRSKQGLKSAIAGAQRVAVPVIFAVLTSVAAFAPLLAVEGIIGKFMRVIPLIVIPTLAFSLVESLFILPAHLSHYRPQREGRQPSWFLPRYWRNFQQRFADGVRRFIDRVYRPSLEFGLRWRYLTLAVGVSTLLITVGLVVGGWVRFTFLPSVEADWISAAVTLPLGSPVDATEKAVLQLEESAGRLEREMSGNGGDGLFVHTLAAIGAHPYRRTQNERMGEQGRADGFSASHLGEVTIELAPAEDRTAASEDLVNRWRELTGPIPDALESDFSASLFTAGEDINVQLVGQDIAKLRAAADALKERLDRYAGVFDVTDSFREGKEEIKLNIQPAAETYGLRLADVARQVRQAFYGEEAQRIQRGRDDIRVMVRYPEDERRSLGDLENMRIRARGGLEVPFSEVAVAERGRGYSSIKRVDRRRAVNVTAAVDRSKASAGTITAELESEVLPEILADFPGIGYSLEGQESERRDSLRGLAKGFALALFIIYALLAIPLRSYIQPAIIMSAIPFGLVGAIWGHLIMGMDLTIISMFGIVALGGVVVNDSLIIVHFINERRAAGGPLQQAVRDAGVTRFRPILLTSLTTFGGLTPLLLERSMQARFLIPMAISLGFGVMFATFITLVLVPSAYLIVNDVKMLALRLLRRPARPEPAVTREGAR